MKLKNGRRHPSALATWDARQGMAEWQNVCSGSRIQRLPIAQTGSQVWGSHSLECLRVILLASRAAFYQRVQSFAPFVACLPQPGSHLLSPCLPLVSWTLGPFENVGTHSLFACYHLSSCVSYLFASSLPFLSPLFPACVVSYLCTY